MATYGWFNSSLLGKVFSLMDEMGIFDYILPWLLYYALIYGLLAKVNLFGKDQNDEKGDKINRIVALAMSTLIIYYVPQSKMISEFLAELFTKWGVFAITLLLIPLTIAILGVNIKSDILDADKGIKKGLLGVGAVIIFIIFYGTLGNMFKEYWLIIDPYTIAIAIILIILGLIIGSVTCIMGDNNKDNEKNNN